MTPYSCAIIGAKAVMSGLIVLMTHCEDMKLFKNIAAVYIVWQQETNDLQLEELNWKTERNL